MTVSAERQQEKAAAILEDYLAQCLAAGEGEVLAKLVTAQSLAIFGYIYLLYIIE